MNSISSSKIFIPYFNSTLSDKCPDKAWLALLAKI